MVGDGPEKRARRAARAPRSASRKHVLFLGNQEVMEELLPLADVFLLPSSTESFGLVALEAMSAGVPVVRVERGRPARAGRARDVRVPRAGRRPVARTCAPCSGCSGDAPLRRRFGRGRTQGARERFDVDRVVERYRKVYEGPGAER
jgi:glycosyltransferase involved in cell wall biosynthesis